MSIRSSYAGGLVCVLLTLAAGRPMASTMSGGGTAPFLVLDNVEGSFVNLNLFPVRPLVAHPSGAGFLALNTHASTVERFDANSPLPVQIWDVPWGPVAARLWTNSQTQETQLLVSCRGSQVLAHLDINSGEILQLTRLPAEPGDVLVLEGDRAFVACAALDTVVQIDLLTGTEIHYTPSSNPGFDCKSPLFLARSNSGKVFVAPTHSGNNSTASVIFQRRAGVVLDLEDPSVAVQGLPDVDLFLINPDTHEVFPAGRNVGTTLFGLAVNPVTTRTWILNTEANNKGPSNQGEPAVRGRVVSNRMTILRANLTSPPPGPDLVVDLDDSDPGQAGVQFDPSASVGQPFGLDFRANGNGLIVGLGTDNVVELDKDGVRLGEFDLPDGSLPRAVLVNESAGVFWVHCWGTNEVREYRLSDYALLRVCELSDDPTPAPIARGRQLFYDASHSANNNASCASCHVEGRTDFLVWNLENGPQDPKGPLLTQSMSGLAPLAPFHWRGEREDLEEFNGAFAALLGGTQLKRQEFADFEAFVLSLANPANPYLTRDRELDDSQIPNTVAATALATKGQTDYYSALISGTRVCNTCHSLPTGTNHHIFAGEPTEVVPRRAFNKVAPFNEIYRRLTSKVTIETYLEPGNPGAGTQLENRGYLGVGATHAGLIEDFSTRIDDFFNGPIVDDLTSFVMQVDQGVAPAIHQAFLLNASTLPVVQAELSNYLIPAALARQCDVVVVGSSGPGAVPTRWAWDRPSNTFIPDSSSLGPRTLADFLNAAGTESNTFYGLPVGMARRQSIDRDLDGLVNAQDGAPLVAFVNTADTTPPVFLTPPTLVWNTTSTARLQFETDEPTRYRITYGEGLLPDRCVPESSDCSAVSETWGTSHTPLLTGLMASTAITNGVYVPVTFNYSPVVEVFDRVGNSTSFNMPSFASLPHGPADLNDVIVGELNWRRFNDLGPGPLQARVEAKVRYKHGAPPQPAAPGYLVVWRILVDGEVNDTWVPLGNSSFRADELEWLGPTGSKFMDTSGPLLLGLATDGLGETHADFEIPGLQLGQQVTVNIEGVTWVDPAQLSTLNANLASTSACATAGGPGPCVLAVPVTFHGRAGTRWSMPDTGRLQRSITEPINPSVPTTIPLF